MQDWENDFEWLRVKHLVKKALQRDELPDLNAILFLIGVQELGRWSKFTKEEKQDLMHIGVCRVLEYEDCYEFVGRDADGWPHYKELQPVSVQGLKQQEDLLRKNIIRYFRDLEQENGGLE
ncbi:MAG: hypothetical protein AB8G22_05845 [Saprospiraceae bacterium]